MISVTPKRSVLSLSRSVLYRDGLVAINGLPHKALLEGPISEVRRALCVKTFFSGSPLVWRSTFETTQAPVWEQLLPLDREKYSCFDRLRIVVAFKSDAHLIQFKLFHA